MSKPWEIVKQFQEKLKQPSSNGRSTTAPNPHRVQLNSVAQRFLPQGKYDFESRVRKVQDLVNESSKIVDECRPPALNSTQRYCQNCNCVNCLDQSTIFSSSPDLNSTINGAVQSFEAFLEIQRQQFMMMMTQISQAAGLDSSVTGIRMQHQTACQSMTSSLSSNQIMPLECGCSQKLKVTGYDDDKLNHKTAGPPLENPAIHQTQPVAYEEILKDTNMRPDDASCSSEVLTAGSSMLAKDQVSLKSSCIKNTTEGKNLCPDQQSLPCQEYESPTSTFNEKTSLSLSKNILKAKDVNHPRANNYSQDEMNGRHTDVHCEGSFEDYCDENFKPVRKSTHLKMKECSVVICPVSSSKDPATKDSLDSCQSSSSFSELLHNQGVLENAHFKKPQQSLGELCKSKMPSRNEPVNRAINSQFRSSEEKKKLLADLTLTFTGEAVEGVTEQSESCRDMKLRTRSGRTVKNPGQFWMKQSATLGGNEPHKESLPAGPRKKRAKTTETKLISEKEENNSVSVSKPASKNQRKEKANKLPAPETQPKTLKPKGAPRRKKVATVQEETKREEKENLTLQVWQEATEKRCAQRAVCKTKAADDTKFYSNKEILARKNKRGRGRAAAMGPEEDPAPSGRRKKVTAVQEETDLALQVWQEPTAKTRTKRAVSKNIVAHDATTYSNEENVVARKKKPGRGRAAAIGPKENQASSTQRGVKRNAVLEDSTLNNLAKRGKRTAQSSNRATEVGRSKRNRSTDSAEPNFVCYFDAELNDTWDEGC